MPNETTLDRFVRANLAEGHEVRFSTIGSSLFTVHVCDARGRIINRSAGSSLESAIIDAESNRKAVA